MRAGTAGAKLHAVIAAFDGIANQLAIRKPKTSMRTPISQGYRFAGFGAVQNDVPAHDAAAQQRAANLAPSRRHVPLIARIGDILRQQMLWTRPRYVSFHIHR